MSLVVAFMIALIVLIFTLCLVAKLLGKKLIGVVVAGLGLFLVLTSRDVGVVVIVLGLTIMITIPRDWPSKG